MADSPRIEELKRRVLSDPASIAFAALAEEYRRAERFEEAIAACTAGLVRHPSYLSAHVTLGRALIEVGRLEAAREELEYVLKLAPENLAAIRGLAEIHHRTGQDASEHSQTEESMAPAAPEAPSETIAEIRAASGASSQPLATEETPSSTDEMSVVAAQVSPADRDMIRPYSEPFESEPVQENAPHVTLPTPVEPALAGLEEFLGAIQRIRAARAAAR
jgi:tetratricopeptide (TPR) repeat protein